MNVESSEKGIILIVDDNPTNLGVLSDCFSDSGFEVLVAQDGESALEKGEYAQPDIILLDVLMPGIDGFETCRRLKAKALTQDIPVIFMTALSEIVDKVRGFQLGAVDYITKPVQYEEVLARVTTHLTIRKLNQRLQQQNICLQQEIQEREQAEAALRQAHYHLEQKNQQLQTEITEHQHTLQSLRQSEQRFQKLVANVPGMIYQFLLGTDGSISFPYISASCRDIYELEPEVIQQNATLMIDIIHPDDRERFEQSVAVSAQSLQPWNWEGQIILKSGKSKWIQGAARPEQQENGDILWDGMVMDITQLKEAETAVRMALEKEQELSELKSRFVSMTSHEFRIPLTTILSSAQMLENYRHRLTEDRQIIHLHRVQTAVQRMIEMLDDVLLFSKAEAGKLEFNPTPLDVLGFCHQVVEEFQLSAGEDYAIAFTHECHDTSTVPEGSPERSPTYLEEKLLQKILSNLLSNAIKYSPKGGTVHFSLIRSPASVTFKVQDQGIGIPLEDQERLFESFHRATNVGNIQGTGLGLAIVKNCVDLHGGQITVESTVGVGTTFTVTLPVNQPKSQRSGVGNCIESGNTTDGVMDD